MIKIFDKLLKHEKALNKAYNDFEKGLGKVAENELNESLK